MNALTANPTHRTQATDVRFRNRHLLVALNGGREVSLPLDDVPWLRWLARATHRQRANWKIEPGGYAIYWPDLDDGFEVCHLLAMEPLSAA